MAAKGKLEIMKKEKEDWRQSKRKEFIQKIMFDKGIPAAKVNEQKKITDFIAQEVQEVIQIEDQVVKGYIDLYQHQKKRRHQSKKKMLDLQIFQTSKKILPSNSMLLLREVGNVKATCFQRKLNFGFISLMKDLKKRRHRVEEKEENEKSKDEEIKRQIRLFQKRENELEYGLVKKRRRRNYGCKMER